MTSARSGQPALQERSLLLGSLAFGFLVAITAVVFVMAAGGGVIAAIIAYVAAGSLGLVGMAATALWRDHGPRTGTIEARFADFL